MDRVEELAGPGSIGEALHGDLSDRWKYRAGGGRITAAIHDKLVVVEVIEANHRAASGATRHDSCAALHARLARLSR